MAGWYFIIVLTVILLALACREIRECDTLGIDTEYDKTDADHAATPPSLKKAKKRKNGWCDYPQKPKDLVALLTLAAVAYYTWLTREEVQSTNKQVLIMQDQEDRQLRGYAYTTIKDASFSGTSGVVDIQINALGQTPVYHVHSVMKGEFSCPGENLNVPSPNTWPIDDIIDVIFPGEDNEWNSVKFKLTSEQLANFGKCQLVTYGQVLYLDAFRDPHVTTFCYLYDPKSPDGQFTQICPVMNGSDGENHNYQDMLQNPKQPVPWSD